MSYYDKSKDEGWKPVWDAMKCELADTSPAKPIRTVTILIIIANVLVYFYTGDLMFDSFFNGISLEKAQTLIDLAGVSCIANLSCWKAFVASMFIHWGFLHLLGNMYFLWIVGDNVETTLGSIRYLALYLIAGFLGTLTQAVFIIVHGYQPYPVFVVGASGAISGIMGAYLLLWPGATHCMCFGYRVLYYCFKVSAAGKIGLWILFQTAIILLGLPVGVWAHLTGFITGIALASLLVPRQNIEKLRDELYQGKHRGMKPEPGELAFPSLLPWVKWLLYALSIVLIIIAISSYAGVSSIAGNYYSVVAYIDKFGRTGYEGILTPTIPTMEELHFIMLTENYLKIIKIIYSEQLIHVGYSVLIVLVSSILTAIISIRALRNAEKYEVTYIGFERAEELFRQQSSKKIYGRNY